MTKRFERSLELSPKLGKSRRQPLRSLTIERRWTSPSSLEISKPMRWKWRWEKKEISKKKVIAFKATPSSIEEEDLSEDGDEDFAMLIRRIGKIFYKKGRPSNFRRGRPQGRFEKKEEEMGLTFIARRRVISLRIAPHFRPLPPRTCIRRKRRW